MNIVHTVCHNMQIAGAVPKKSMRRNREKGPFGVKAPRSGKVISFSLPSYLQNMGIKIQVWKDVSHPGHGRISARQVCPTEKDLISGTIHPHKSKLIPQKQTRREAIKQDWITIHTTAMIHRFKGMNWW